MAAEEPSGSDEPPSHWIDSKQARELTTLTRQQIENLLRARKLPAQKNSKGHWRIDPEAVSRYAVDARKRKAAQLARRRATEAASEINDTSLTPQNETPMEELARLRARVRTLEDEIAFERDAAERRWASEAAREQADKRLEKALRASRRARQKQSEEIHGLEARIVHLRGPGHPGELEKS